MKKIIATLAVLTMAVSASSECNLYKQGYSKQEIRVAHEYITLHAMKPYLMIKLEKCLKSNEKPKKVKPPKINCELLKPKGSKITTIYTLKYAVELSLIKATHVFEKASKNLERKALMKADHDIKAISYDDNRMKQCIDIHLANLSK
jgi:ribosomal protein L7/L12